MSLLQLASKLRTRLERKVQPLCDLVMALRSCADTEGPRQVMEPTPSEGVDPDLQRWEGEGGLIVGD